MKTYNMIGNNIGIEVRANNSQEAMEKAEAALLHGLGGDIIFLDEKDKREYMYELNENEKLFVEILDNAKKCCKGELELDLCVDEDEGFSWFAMDYREELEGAFAIAISPYDKPLISEERAEEMRIDVRKCCDAVGAFIVG